MKKSAAFRKQLCEIMKKSAGIIKQVCDKYKKQSVTIEINENIKQVCGYFIPLHVHPSPPL